MNSSKYLTQNQLMNTIPVNLVSPAILVDQVDQLSGLSDA